MFSFVNFYRQIVKTEGELFVEKDIFKINRTLFHKIKL